jgi:hypothetical protein
MFKLGQVNPNMITVTTNPELILQTLQQILRIEQANRQQPNARNTLGLNGEGSEAMEDDKNVKPEKDTEIYQSLDTYSFPRPHDAQMMPQPRPKGQSVKTENANMITTTQTFELWNSFSTPPAAFPTPESIAAYPKFFRVDQQSQQPHVEEIEDDEEEEALDEERPAKKKRRQGSQILCRRLSVLRPEGSSNTPQTPSDNAQTNSTPASVGVFFQHIISCITKLIDAERTTLFMYDKSSDELCAQVSIGEAEIRIPSDKGVAGTVFTSGKSANENFDGNRTSQTRCVICAPVIVTSRSQTEAAIPEERIVGVIEVLNKHTGLFTKVDEDNLKTIAQLLSIFLMEQLNNYYLYNDKQEDEEEAIKKILLSQVLLLAPSSYRRKSKAQVAPSDTQGAPQPDVQGHPRSSLLLGSFSGSLGEDMNLFDGIEDITDLFGENNAPSANNALGLESQPSLDLGYSFMNTTPAPQPQVNVINNQQGMPMQQVPQQVHQIQQQQMQRQNVNPSQQNILSFLNSQRSNQQQMPQQQFMPTSPSQGMQQQVPFGMPPQKAMQDLSIDKKRKRGKEPEGPTVAMPQHQPLQHQRPKAQPDNVPFMHFRIPRYELQFIQFDGNNGDNGIQQGMHPTGQHPQHQQHHPHQQHPQQQGYPVNQMNIRK